MLRCKSPSSSEHMESSKDVSEEASEDKNSLTEASESSELSGTEESCSEHVGIMWVGESAASELSLPKTEKEEEEGRSLRKGMMGQKMR